MRSINCSAPRAMNVVHFMEIPSWLRRSLNGARSGSSAKWTSESLEILEANTNFLAPELELPGTGVTV
jgi:hypothetical protein